MLVAGWTILAHPLFLDAIEQLVGVVESEEAAKPEAPPSGNAKLLGHLLDLALVKIPHDLSNAAYRHGGSLADRRHWFRGKTGGGRYRLFYRYDSRAKIIIYPWVNHDSSLRTYGSRTDTYAGFAKMLDSGNPPDMWDDLMEAADAEAALRRLGQFAAEVGRRKG